MADEHPQLRPGQRLRRAQGVLYAPDGDDGGVLLSLADLRQFKLNVVGCCVWELLAAPATLDELCAGVGEAFDTDPAACEADVAAFLAALSARNLLDRIAGVV